MLFMAASTVAAKLASSTGPAAAGCIASPVQDDNPTNGVRTGLVEPAANHLWISGTLLQKDMSKFPYVERFDPATGWSRWVLSTLQQSAFNSIAAFSTQH